VTEIAMFTDDPGWHGARLSEAFALRGAGVHFVSLRDCRFALDRPEAGIVIPGFGDRLPDGVFVRGVPGGTLEQVVLRLDVLHALKLMGVPVYNDGRAIERTVDKAMTSLVLASAGVPTPATWVTESAGEARAIAQAASEAGDELVLKPMFGSRGVGLVRIGGPAALPAPEACDGVYYLQRYVGSAGTDWHDWRVFVIGGDAVAAMRREGKSWITNVSQGGRCFSIDLEVEREIASLAARASRLLELDHAGVDLMRDREGRLQVIEVNGIPAWKGLQSVAAEDIAHRLAQDFVARHLPRPGLQSVA